MKTQKLTRRQWATIAILSCCGALAFSVQFSMPNIPDEQQINALAEIVTNLQKSLSGTTVNTSVKLQKMVKENQRKLDTEWKVLKHYLNQEFASVQKKFNSVQKDYSSVQKEFPGIQKAVRDVKNSQNAKTFFVYI